MTTFKVRVAEWKALKIAEMQALKKWLDSLPVGDRKIDYSWKEGLTGL